MRHELSASASLRAVRGVTIAAEIPGLVQKIHFTPGAVVKENDLLVTLDADADIARLRSLQAVSELSKITYDRDKTLYTKGAVNKAQLDTDKADLDSKQAQVSEQAAIVDKKIIRAPFPGRLGISAVNPGQYLNPGDKIVTLQDLNPIYVDFYVPQQDLTQLSIDQTVKVTVDAFPGKITTIDPVVDTNTRNVQIEATVDNPKETLIPGMFANITVSTGKPVRYLTLPQTAISFNPYGNIVYIIKNNIATQTFVKTGDTRGDQIAILSGLKEGDLVATSGQLKLKNNTPVVIDNTVAPSNNPSPHAVNCDQLIDFGVGITIIIYTEVGLVTLIGLISKHLNSPIAKCREREAIQEAAGIRLRPFLMTTAAMVLGVTPLITATGAGAVSRFNIGLVIASGISIGTLFTLFVVPAMYMFLAKDRSLKK